MGELRVVAELMAVAARTAPKTKGEDCLVMRIVEGPELQVLGQKMAEYGATSRQEELRPGRPECRRVRLGPAHRDQGGDRPRA